MKRYNRLYRFSMAVFVLVLGLSFFSASSALAEDPVKIAVLTDMSGPYGAICGPDVEAAKIAIEDFGGKVLGQDIIFIARDMLCKPDVANQKAKELYEKEKVDVIFDVPNSAAGLAVSNQALLHKKIYFSVSSGTTKHTTTDCNRYTFDWAYNNYMLATAVGRWAPKNIGKKWYSITADYAWGHDLLANFSKAFALEGGKHLGNDMVALGTADFSPYIMNALNKDPDLVALFNTGKDGINSTKQAIEFGLKKKAKLIHALLFIQSVKAVGPEVFGGDYVASAWYWKSKNPGSKEFVEKYRKRVGTPPNWLQAANYSAVTQYLEAVKRAGTKDTRAVIKALEGHTFRDLIYQPGRIRAEDHMAVGKAYILRVNNPDEIKEPWDYFQIVGSVDADEAFMAPEETGCNMGGF